MTRAWTPTNDRPFQPTKHHQYQEQHDPDAALRGRPSPPAAERQSGSPEPDVRTRHAPGDDLEKLKKPALYEQARQLKVRGRSSMTKKELIDEIRRRRSTAAVPRHSFTAPVQGSMQFATAAGGASGSRG